MKQLIMTLSFSMFFFSSLEVFGQEWTEAQKNVWNNVVTYWQLYEKGDLEGYLSYIHPDYLGWPYEIPVPRDKSTSRKWHAHDMEVTTLLVYDITPVGIRIHDDVAVVHYYFRLFYRDRADQEHSSTGRWTDILKKEDDRWLLIADHGGHSGE